MLRNTLLLCVSILVVLANAGAAYVFAGPTLAMSWDGTQSDWGELIDDPQHSHWSPDSTDLPSLDVGAAVDAGICTVPAAYIAEAKTMDVGPDGTLIVNGTLDTGNLTTAEDSTLGGSGTIAAAGEVWLGGDIAPGNSLGVLTLDVSGEGAELVDTAVYKCEIGADDAPTANDVIHVAAGNLALAGTLELMVTSKLRGPDGGGEWIGEQTRTIITTEGDSSVMFYFATTPTPLPVDFGTAEWGEGHLGRGVFLTRENNGGENDVPGVSYSATDTTVHLFQAADGDTNGDMILDERDLQAIEASGTFPHSVTGLPADWLQGDFTGDGACDSLDIQAIAATGLWRTNFNPDGRYYPPSPGDKGGPGAAVDLIANASTGSLTLSTPDVVLSGFVIQSREGIFGGAPAGLSGRFREDADYQIGDHLEFVLTGEHNLGNVIDTEGLASPEFDWNRDLTFTYTIEGVPGTYTGALIVVPEPATLALLLMGAAGLLAFAWRKRKRFVTGAAGLALVANMGHPAYAEMVIQLRETLPVPAGYPVLAAVADLDGDAAVDVVLRSGGSSSSYKILERDGAGLAERFAWGPQRYMNLSVADVDRDGRAEILSSTQSSPGRVWIHEATGDNVYDLVHQSSYGTWIDRVAAGDSNGNGKGEFFIARESFPSRVFILEGTADNTYTNLGSVTGHGGNSWVTGTADLDGDGKMELVFGDDRYRADQTNTYVYENGSLVYENNSLLPFYGLGDTDGNGRLEIIGTTCNFMNSAHTFPPDVRILESTGDNGFEEVLSAPGLYGAIDVDGDEQTELLRAKTGHSGEENVLSINTRLGTQLTEIWNSSMLFQNSQAAINVYSGVLAIGDTDGNGYPELAVLQADQLHILEVVPEPSSIAFLAAGAACSAAYAFRKTPLRRMFKQLRQRRYRRHR